MVTVSIVTFHTDAEELERCLSALSESVARRVYVVDNGSDAYIEEICRRYDVDYTASANNGYGTAHNIAIRRAIESGATYHLVMNSDIEFTPEDLVHLEDYMDAHPEVGQLQPEILLPDGTPQYACRLLPTPFDLILRRFIPGWMFAERRRRYLLAGADRSREFDCAYQQGSFMFLRTEALRKTGLFDERFFMYPEDIDLSRRMARNYKVRFLPSVVIVHHHRAASYRSWRMLRIHMVNMFRYFNKWGWFFDSERRHMNRIAGR